MFRKILILCALLAGMVALPASGAFASTTPPPQCQQCDGNWNHNDGRCVRDSDDCVCRRVITPTIVNLTYVENTNPTVVTVTLYGTFYWVQVKDTNGHITYLGPTTTEVTLTPGESISVAWKGDPDHLYHGWCWTGEVCYPCPPRHDPCWNRDCVPCNPPVWNWDPCHQHGDGNGPPLTVGVA